MVFVGNVGPGIKPCHRTKFTRGGSEASDEANLMVNEKIAAAFEAAETLLTGGDLCIVVDRYREHVTANATRLAGKGRALALNTSKR